MISDKDFALLKKYSERDFDFSKSEQTQHSKRVKSVDEGVVNITSGYLAVCEALNIDAYRQLAFARDMGRGWGGRGRIKLYNPIWNVPKMMQGGDFVAFRNLFGDGCFAVLSSKDRFYVETDSPTNIAHRLVNSIREGDVEEKKGSRLYRLEGFVGVGGGIMAVTDPKNNSMQYPKCPRGKHEISTILSVKPGIYACRFIEDGKKLAIRKKN
ncbi:MAG TPA: hypothetical protein VJA86_02285 [Candidatus Nanoarchaeia archaeon]|nr:hypothetical protein [Thermodesulfovibrionia bacterium]HLD37391.1 hypothetical protein [Candidatus Nanoarchaeia archaeon]